MNKKDYKAIAEIMNKDIGITKSTKRVICNELADYFEEEQTCLQHSKQHFNREQFLKDCRV